MEEYRLVPYGTVPYPDNRCCSLSEEPLKFGTRSKLGRIAIRFILNPWIRIPTLRVPKQIYAYLYSPFGCLPMRVRYSRPGGQLRGTIP
jgi:hypothetical protein